MIRRVTARTPSVSGDWSAGSRIRPLQSRLSMISAPPLRSFGRIPSIERRVVALVDVVEDQVERPSVASERLDGLGDVEPNEIGVAEAIEVLCARAWRGRRPRRRGGPPRRRSRGRPARTTRWSSRIRIRARMTPGADHPRDEIAEMSRRGPDDREVRRLRNALHVPELGGTLGHQAVEIGREWRGRGSSFGGDGRWRWRSREASDGRRATGDGRRATKMTSGCLDCARGIPRVSPSAVPPVSRFPFPGFSYQSSPPGCPAYAIPSRMPPPWTSQQYGT